MNEETMEKICKDCDMYMKEIGEINKSTLCKNPDGTYGKTEIKTLYQCLKCMKVVIN